MEKHGAGFVTRDGYNLLAGAEEWVAPVHAQVGSGRRRVGRRLVQLHRPAQPDAAGLQQRAGQRVRDLDARSASRPHLSRRPKGTRRPRTPALSAVDRARSRPVELVAALSSDNMLWRLHAQRLLVERGGQDACPRSSRSRATRRSTRSAPTARHCTRSGRWTASAPCSDPTSEAGRAPVAALKHPAAGVRKAAAMVRGHTPEAVDRRSWIRRTAARHDLHTRLAAILRAGRLPRRPTPSEGPLRGQPGAGQLRRPLAEPGAVHRRPPPPGALPHAVSRRPGRRSGDCPAAAPAPREQPARLAAAGRQPSPRTGRTMEVPGSWESRGLPNFDGVVWFTRDVRWPAVAGARRRSASGASATPPRSGSTAASVAAAAGRPTGGPQPAGLRGARRRARRPARTRSPCASRTCAATAASWARPRPGASQGGEHKAALAGTWQSPRRAADQRGGALRRPGELAAHLASAATPPPAERGPAAAPATAKADVVLRSASCRIS